MIYHGERYRSIDDLADAFHRVDCGFCFQLALKNARWSPVAIVRNVARDWAESTFGVRGPDPRNTVVSAGSLGAAVEMRLPGEVIVVQVGPQEWMEVL